jgi:type IV fimbrial biogenesis protein FimT
MNRQQTQAGFTLTELMVVIAIVAILLSIGVPSYKYISNSYRISAEVNGLLGDAEFARSEAIKEGQQIVLCTSTTLTTCAGVDTWQVGWIVCVDLNNNGTCDAGEPVLRTQQTWVNTDTFVSNALGNPASTVVFNREGFAVGFPAQVIMTLHDATANPAWTRCLEIQTVGLMTVLNHITAPASCT